MSNPVWFQPRPEEFMIKRVFFTRLQEMAVQLQRARRTLGYKELVAKSSAVQGCESVTLTAKQSGMIVIEVWEPQDQLHLERPRFVWDEAMFEERMA